jgi:hypothetical protein
MRIAFPIFGFVAGFSAGAGLVSGVTGDGFLSTVFSWVVGLCVALLFAALAYFFYAFAVVLAFAGLGFSAVAVVLTALNMDWNWLVVLLGTAAGVLFGIFAVASSLPMVLLVVATSFFGVSMIIYGLLLILNIANFGDFSNGTVYRAIRSHAGVYILWLSLGMAAAVTQLRVIGAQTKMAEQYWNGSKTFDDLVVEMNGAPAKKSKK